MKKITLLLLAAASFTACKSTKSATATAGKPTTTEELNAANESKQLMQAGNDFHANGNSPANWELTMSFANKTTFTSNDGLSLSFATNTLQSSTQGSKTTYTGKVSAVNISIVMEDGTCTVPTIRKVYEKLVTVTINQKVYSGCGAYLVDNNLEGKWNLEKIGTAPINIADYNKAPSFNFEIAKGRMSGNDGCNSVGGNIELLGSKIRFAPVVSTMMACVKGKNIASVITSGMSGKTVDYYFKEGKLYLYLADDTLLVFTRG